MNNEETILDPQYTQTSENEKKEKPVEKKTTWGEKAAYAAGGAVFGAGATLAGQASASHAPEIVTEPEVVAETEEAETDKTEHQSNTAEQPKPENSPAPEDTIIATATGVRVAQVDDDASFSQAFADARAQVGAGGVFEWHGRVYSTFYKDEWESMSAAERQEYQASIDYNDIVSDDHMAEHRHEHTSHNSNVHHASVSDDTDAHVVETGTATTEDEVEVHVLEVGETDLNNDGVPENAAIIEVNGHQILMVDIDQDGVADIAMCDANGNGQLDEGEIVDLSDQGVMMPEMSDGDLYYAQAEGEPDYMNDANVGLYEV